MTWRTFSVLLGVLSISAGCGRAVLRASPFPHGDAIQLLEAPAHLGDGRASGQSFSAGPATAARVCALVNMPTAADVYLQVLDVRETETLSDQLTVNGRPYALPMTLERDPRGVTPNAMSASPVEHVRLDQGPSEICLVAGHKSNGDIDDFEVAAITLFVEGVDVRDIGVRRGLAQGMPASTLPPSMPWATQQGWPMAPSVPYPVFPPNYRGRR